MKPQRIIWLAGLVLLLLISAACRQAEPTTTPQPAATEPPPATEPPATEPPPTPTERPPEATATPTEAPPAESPLAGTSWTWLEFTAADGTGQSPADPNQYTIAFNAGNTIAVQADCNSGFGSFATGDQSITITVEGLTLALCPEGSLSDRFVQLLNQAEQYQVAGETLTLTGPAGVMSLTSGEVPAPPAAVPPLTDGTWRWLQFQGADGTLVAVPDPSRYTLIFQTEGNVDILSDCNSGFGLYAMDGDSLTIDLQSMSVAQCDPGSLSEDYVAWLGQAAGFVIQGNLLFLNLAAEDGTLHFTRAEVAPPAAGNGEIAPDAVAIELNGLADTYEWVIVEPTPYDAGQPSGPTGLPRHLALTFDGDPLSTTRQMLIIPAAAYQSLWSDAGNPLIGDQMARLKVNVAAGDGSLPMPILPPPAGSNDLAAQIRLLNLFQGEGLRFIGRTSQDPSPVLSGSLNYYFQGFITVDGTEYLVSLVSPLTTSLLPDSTGDLTAQQQDLLANNFPAYLAQVNALLEQAAPTDFAPDLEQLDAMAASLRVSPQGTGPGQAIQNIIWQWESFTDPATGPTPVADPAAYTVLFLPNGQVQIQADCNEASGIYNVNGQAIGVVIGTVTQEVCPVGSQSEEFLRLLGAAALFFKQDEKLYIDLKFDSGTLQFAPGADLEAGSPSPPPPAGNGGGIAPSLIQIDLAGLADSFQWQMVPSTPYDAGQPAGSGGIPAHIVVTFDSEEPATAERRLHIIPVQPYINLWNAAGDSTIQRRLDQLTGLLAAQPAQPATVGLLPPQAGMLDVLVQPAYLTFGRGLGSGVRFIGRTSQEPSPVSNDQLNYYFEGLTNDGQFYVALIWPVAAAGFPDTAADVPAADQSLLAADYDLYLQQINATLAAVPRENWLPPLDQLDALVSSLALQP